MFVGHEQIVCGENIRSFLEVIVSTEINYLARAQISFTSLLSVGHEQIVCGEKIRSFLEAIVSTGINYLARARISFDS